MKKPKLITFIAILTFLNFSTVFSQSLFQFKLSENISKVSLYPVEDKGILIFEMLYVSKKNQELKITLLNNVYEQKWTKKFEHIGFTLDRIKLSEDKKKVFASFFSDSKKNQWSHRVLYNEKLRIVAINLEDGTNEIMDAEIPSNATLQDFGSTDEMIYAHFSDKGTFKNKAYAIVKSLQTKQNHVVELGEDITLIDYIGCYTTNNDGSIYTMLSYKDKAKDFIGCEIDQIKVDGQLTKISKTALSEEKEWPFDCVAFHVENSIRLFGYDMLNSAMTMDMIEPASSFALLKLENNKVSSFVTTGFGDLKHPMISINENVLTGFIESKIKENKAKKGKLDQAFNIVSHPTIKSGDLYYSFFESYAPIYDITTSKSPSGMSSSQTKKYSESFFPHLQVACFDAEGNLKWDNNCKLKKFTREKGNANSTWQVNEDGTVSAVTHTNNYQIFLYKAKNGNTVKEEKSTFRDILNESEWKDMVGGSSIILSGSQYSFSVVAIPFNTDDSNWKVCYFAQKDKKSPYYLVFKPYKF
ncbi:MAG: hypothetical protein HXX18_14000 [Bacteroidetes bacterium]|nr:hypothetical protein [Bacteroidota bacterium]